MDNNKLKTKKTTKTTTTVRAASAPVSGPIVNNFVLDVAQIMYIARALDAEKDFVSHILKEEEWNEEDKEFHENELHDLEELAGLFGVLDRRTDSHKIVGLQCSVIPRYGKVARTDYGE
jgi:hypothetical protein